MGCATCCCSASPGSTARTQDVLRLAAAAGRDVGYPLLRALAELPEATCASRCAGRWSRACSSPTGDGQLPVPPRAARRGRCTPPSCPASARSSTPGSPRSSSAAAPRDAGGAGAALGGGRSPRRRARRIGRSRARGARRSSASPRRTPTSSGRSSCGTSCRTPPTSCRSTSVGSAHGPPSSPARPARRHARSSSRGERSSLPATDDRASAHLYGRLGRYLHESGRTDAALAAFERMVALVPPHPPSAERAEALAASGRALLAWRFERSLADLRAGARARACRRRARAEVRALTCSAATSPTSAAPRRASCSLARRATSPRRSAIPRACSCLRLAHRRADDARTARRVGARRARRGSRPCAATASTHRARRQPHRGAPRDRRVGRGRPAQCRRGPQHHRQLPVHAAHAPRRPRGRARRLRGRPGAPRRRPRHAARGPGPGDLRRLPGRAGAVGAPLGRRRRRPWRRPDQGQLAHAAQLRVWFSAKGLRAQAELAALARARRDADAAALARPRGRSSRSPAAPPPRRQRSHPTPAAGWPLPKPSTTAPTASPGPTRGPTRPHLGPPRTPGVGGLLPLARDRGARRRRRAARRGEPPLRDAHAVATRVGAEPLLRELELLAQRARLDLARPSRDRPREAGLERAPRPHAARSRRPTLVARGYTNPEIAATLVISVKTASVHVSNILRKLDAPTGVEAAAIAHRLAAPGRTPAERGL